ncbi:MAG TPA: nascent polypeptide-associated complex protein [Methanosarcinales archaeon]|nr:nascent polypeptide-associated complex protein [Methanosarcinales archaeon]HUX99648.1 nascent polypeptide-associated complex protein [Candidatus Deferrimicrobium sp.]
MSKWHKIKKMQQKAKKSNPKDMKRMMKKLSKDGQMDFEEIENVEEVIIRAAEREIVIQNPQVTKLQMPGQGDVFQIVGQGTERGRSAAELTTEPIEDSEEEMIIAPEDAQLVAEQAGVSIEEAIAALKENQGDLAKAILYLKQTSA